MSNNQEQNEHTENPSELTAAVGTHVVVELRDRMGAAQRLEFDIVPDKQSNFSAGFMSERAPLAQAILGHAAGDSVEYMAPSREPQTVTIMSIVTRAAAGEAAPDRDAVLDEARDKIARRESRQIALTAELHYGSIDPDGIKED